MSNKTPKEKAKKLVNNFYQPLGHLKCGVNNTIMWEHAKQCALLCVDEILSSQPILPSTPPQITMDRCCPQAEEYWEEVKKEIELL